MVSTANKMSDSFFWSVENIENMVDVCSVPELGAAFRKFVSYAPHRENKAGFKRFTLDFNAQTIDMRINRMFVSIMPITPYTIQKLVTIEHLSRMFSEMPE